MALAQKLQLKPGQTFSLLNAPAGYTNTLEMEGIAVSPAAEGEAEAVLLFVNTLQEARQRFPEGMRLLRPQGLYWIAYPKGTSKVKTDVNRDRLWEALSTTGWRPVRQVALDEVWSAMRFRPEGEVGK